jgi:uncharacterized protein DUF2490
MKLKLLPAYFLVAMTAAASAQSRAVAPEEDTEVWNDVQAVLPLHKKVDLMLNGQLRIGRNVSHLVTERVGASLIIKAERYFTFSTGYLYQGNQPAAGLKNYESRIQFAGTARLPLGRFTISDRNMIERRMREPENSTRYRNLLRVEHPVKLGRLQAQAFVWDEVFYDWSTNNWVRHRIAAGVSKKLSERFTLELYYMRQNDGRSLPGDLHVIGAIYKVRF